jgi:glucose/arabinose dehydrogenase
VLRWPVIHTRTGWGLRAGLLVVVLASICVVLVVDRTTSHAVADVPDVALTPVGMFSSPVYVTSPPGDPSRLFVVERGGTVRVVKDGVVLPTPFLDVSGEISTQDERGLLSMAFAPDYAISGLVYAFGTLTNGTLTVWEFHAAPGSDVADAGHRTVLSIPHSAANHNGGQLQFGPDGYLYIGIGDGGSAGGPNGQNAGVLLGKILRIDPRANPSTGAQYSIPPGQPFASGVLPEIYAYGLRNPWRFSFDGLSGDLMIGDVGDNNWEEIDELPAGAPPGANFGWYCWEGTHVHGPAGCAAPGALSPIYEYAHDATHCSISGGFVARDPTVPSLAGRFLFADYCGAGASALLLPVGSAPDIVQLGAVPGTAGFGKDSDDHLYITSLKGGVWRITGTGAADKPPVAAFTLSSTTPAVGANVHLDASTSTDPDGPIYRYAWDTDGDGRVDATGVTADVTYPTAGARAITLTVTDALGAHSSRTLPVYVGGKTTPPGTSDVATKLTASFSAPAHQKLKDVRKHGLFIRFRTSAPATWTIKSSLVRTRKMHAKIFRRAGGARSAKTFRAQTGTGIVRLKIPRAPLAGMQAVVIRVHMDVRAPGGDVRGSLLVRVG